MTLSSDLAQNGFSLADVDANDLQKYIQITKISLKKYVDEMRDFFGEWNDEVVVAEFNDKMKRSCFQKMLLHDETVGFLSYDIQEEKIDGISINLIEAARNNGIGSAYLAHIIKLSTEQSKPMFLYVMKTNPARNLYERFGFKICEETEALYLMMYEPC